MINKRRILYISYDCITEPLSESQVLPYVKGLSEENEIYLLTFNKKNVADSRLKDIASKYNIREIFSLRYHKRPTLPATAFDIFVGIVKAFIITKKYGISLVHARSYVACAIAYAVKRVFGIPYIFDIRGLLADERADSGDWKRNSLAYRIVKFYEALMLKESDRIVVLSRIGAGMLEGMMEVGKDKISVIPTCVDTQLFIFKEDGRKNERPFRIIYIGSLGTWYMLPEMLDFFKVARGILKDAEFLILTQSDPATISRIIEYKGMASTSVMICKDTHDRVAYYLGVSDLSLFFIRPAFSKKVSCPTKFAESLSMGVPVITNSGVGDLDYYINEYKVGIIVNNFRKEEYERAVRQALDIFKERAALSERCRNLAIKEFSLESGVKKYQAIYESIKI